MNPITKAHRLSVARAWEGDEPTSLFFRTWIDGGLMGSWPTAQETIRMLERLAQLVADAEGKPVDLPFAAITASWASHIAAIDTRSVLVAEYLERELRQLVAKSSLGDDNPPPVAPEPAQEVTPGLTEEELNRYYPEELCTCQTPPGPRGPNHGVRCPAYSFQRPQFASGAGSAATSCSEPAEATPLADSADGAKAPSGTTGAPDASDSESAPSSTVTGPSAIKASSGEAAGDEVTHQEARRMVPSIWYSTEAAPMLRYISQQKAKQEQAEREAARLQMAMARALGMVHEADGHNDAPATWEQLTDGATELGRRINWSLEHQADLEQERDFLRGDRDAERAQKEALRVELEEAKRRIVELDNYHQHLIEAADLIRLRKKTDQHTTRSEDEWLALDACYSPAQQPTEAAPVAKAEAPSEPAGWVPQPGERVRAIDGDCRGRLGNVTDIDTGRTWPYEVTFDNGSRRSYRRRFVAESLEPAVTSCCGERGQHNPGCAYAEPAPQPPATAGGDRLAVVEAQLEMIRVVVLGSRPGCRPFDDAAKQLEKAR